MSDRAGTMFVKNIHCPTQTRLVLLDVALFPLDPMSFLLLSACCSQCPSDIPASVHPPHPPANPTAPFAIHHAVPPFRIDDPAQPSIERVAPNAIDTSICQTIGATIGGSSPKQNTLCVVVVGQNVLN